MFITLFALILAAAGFVWGKIRSDIVALISLVILSVAGVLTPQEALSGFSTPIVIMMAGLFIVGGAIFSTGLAKMIGARLLKLGGGSPVRLFLVVVVATGLIGGFVSNTGTVAIMLPIIVSMAAAADISPARYLMPVAFASSIGGMLTLIGTPPNLVIAETWEELGQSPLTMFTFLPTGVICLAAGTLLLLPLSKLLVSKSDKHSAAVVSPTARSLTQIVEDYNLNHDLWCVFVPEQSMIAGLTLGNLSLRSKYGLDVVEVRQQEKHLLKSVTQESPSAATAVNPGVTLFVRGSRQSAEKFAQDYGLIFDSEQEKTKRNLKFYDIGLAEIIPLPDSAILRKTIGQLDFRNRYNINILAVRRGNKFITESLRDVIIRKGDVLLVQGTWHDIGRLNENNADWVVLGQPADREAQVTIDYKAPMAAFIMVAMIIALVFDAIPAVIAVLIASIAMILTGCFRNATEAYKTINWESLILIAAMMPMSMALEKTGISSMVSSAIVGSLGSLGPHWILAGIYLTTSVMTLFISNTATAVLLAPIAVQSAVDFGVSPLPMLMAVTFGASLCFASPFSTPPNALVMSAGGYTFMDYVKVGGPLQLILGLIMILIIPLIFPF